MSARHLVAIAFRRRRSRVIEATSMASPSMLLAKHGREGKVEDFLAVVAADVRHPIAPVLGSGHQDHRAHDLSGAVARLGQARHGSAAPVERDAISTGAVKTHLNHTRLL